MRGELSPARVMGSDIAILLFGVLPSDPDDVATEVIAGSLRLRDDIEAHSIRIPESANEFRLSPAAHTAGQ
jgi:hypothetical protein